jgi:hypothetical protein
MRKSLRRSVVTALLPPRLLLLLLLLLQFNSSWSFSVIRTNIIMTSSYDGCRRASAAQKKNNCAPTRRTTGTTALGASSDDDESSLSNDEALSKLGYSSEEIQRSRVSSSQGSRNSIEEPVNVNVNLLPEVDAVTLTAVGFGLIAANFFIFANMGDGVIAGVVATVINLMNQ